MEVILYSSGIIKNPITHDDRAKNCQSVIDALASGVLDVDLCHITGNNVVSGDRTSIRNLLKIFAGLLEYFLECAEGNDDEMSSKGNSIRQYLYGMSTFELCNLPAKMCNKSRRVPPRHRCWAKYMEAKLTISPWGYRISFARKIPLQNGGHNSSCTCNHNALRHLTSS